MLGPQSKTFKMKHLPQNGKKGSVKENELLILISTVSLSAKNHQSWTGMAAPPRERLSNFGISKKDKKGGADGEDETFIHPEAMVEDEAVYVDIFRVVDDQQDIKAAMSKAKKQSQKKVKRKSGLDMQMDEEEFTETGGIIGYMERARNLIMRRQIGAAKTYVRAPSFGFWHRLLSRTIRLTRVETRTVILFAVTYTLPSARV